MNAALIEKAKDLLRTNGYVGAIEILRDAARELHRENPHDLWNDTANDLTKIIKFAIKV